MYNNQKTDIKIERRYLIISIKLNDNRLTKESISEEAIN